jgi:hypothetical protein
VILAAFLLGLPFLVRRLKRDLAAQLLVGMLLLVTVVCYVPPVATFVGNNIVLPGQLWRMAWPIPLAALLIFGWMAWETTRGAQLGLNKLGITGRVTGYVPLVLLGVLMSVAGPASVEGVEDVHYSGESPVSGPGCFAAIFPWISDNITKPSVILAPDTQNTCIPAYSAQANVVSVRGSQVLDHLSALERRAGRDIEVPPRALDLQRFFSGATPKERLHILRRYDVDYVMARSDAPTDKRLKSLPGLVPVHVPGDTFNLYKVAHRKVGG